MENDNEIARIKRRIGKCQRRIQKGYVSPKGKETEQHRLERLEKRLFDLEGKGNAV